MKPADPFQLSASATAIWSDSIRWALLTLACIAGAVIWSWLAGKDLNWDSLNYHLYVALQWSEGRLKQDFMAGSVQSYLNPIAYLPFYWMVRAGMHSLIISSILATVHALNLILIALLTSTVLPRTMRWRFAWIVAAVLVAAINPIFATEVGNTFIDVTTSLFVLGGYLVCFRWLVGKYSAPVTQRLADDTRAFLLGGLLLGLACGFKLTNAVFATALWPLVFAQYRGLPRVATRTLAYGAAALVGFLLIEGHWAWTLYREFGNPMFPFSNSFFRSPDFAPVNFIDHRFLPETILERVLLPVRALVPEQSIYTEWCTPDGRFLVFFALLGLVCVKLLWNSARRPAHMLADQGNNERGIAAQWWMIGVWLLAYALWLNLFGIGRYFLAGLLLLGPVIVVLALRLGGAHRFVVYGLALLLTWQVAFCSVAGHRWTPAPWTDVWFDYRIPDELKNEPYLYLSTRSLTHSFVAALVHPKSAFINIAGQATIAENGPGSQRVKDLLRRHQGRVRSFFSIGALDSGQSDDVDSLRVLGSTFDGVYERFNLRTDPKTCLFIDSSDYVRREARKQKAGISFASRFITCELVPVDKPIVLDRTFLRRIDKVFDRIEHACPQRFSPMGTVTVRTPTAWSRTYYNSVVTLVYVPSYDKIEYLLLGGGSVRLGKLADWEGEKPPPHDCSIKKGYKLDQGMLPTSGTAGSTNK